MKDAYYFSHDSNARHDPKVTAMRGVYGPKGYGWYWILVEMMRESDEYRLDMQSKYAFHAFASQMQCECIEAQDFIKDCIEEFGLFKSDGTSFWSESLLRRMEKKEKKSEKARNSANARWSREAAPDKESSESTENEKCESDANASDSMRSSCESDALKESKVKESKGNKRSPYSPPKGKLQFAEIVFLSQEEHDRLVNDFGLKETQYWINQLSDYHVQNQSKPSKIKADHNLSIRNWIRSDQRRREMKTQKPGVKTSLSADELQELEGGGLF
ncbi:DUF4373 domain-containing protein [Paenibacillus sp. P22]|uniref:DUF4373 domain-containing protein n=1 Tax=Paenibacillus sp. P22 TaxID=483908 RepID=UPI00038F8730|nr:DUF4373 domain-containing protein [Paenibacillus sp. P22]CDN41680.1 hypothetical protein BN871_AJ_00320 [Paenibacillus sp. P22]